MLAPRLPAPTSVGAPMMLNCLFMPDRCPVADSFAPSQTLSA
jgi:hypothetical protein